MQHTQHSQFAERIARVEAGGPNTFATVYTGVQDVDTPKGARVKGVEHNRRHSEAPSSAALMRAGLVSGLMQAGFALTLFALYLRFKGL